MQKNISRYLKLTILALVMISGTSLAKASLLTNGEFNTDLSGWTVGASTTTGVTWVSGTARVGQPGTPGLAVFSQSFDILAGNTALDISFEYEWQVNQPSVTDTFLAELVYQSTSGLVTTTLVNEGSNSVAFGPPATLFSASIPLLDLDVVPNNGTIVFSLTENNSPVGTRIELDNVSVVGVVPEASSILIWSCLAGLGFVRVRKRNHS